MHLAILQFVMDVHFGILHFAVDVHLAILHFAVDVHLTNLHFVMDVHYACSGPRAPDTSAFHLAHLIAFHVVSSQFQARAFARLAVVLLTVACWRPSW